MEDRVQCRYGWPYVQRVRADFFNASGGPLTLPFGLAVSDIVVAAGVWRRSSCRRYGNGGETRPFVACSKAYPSSISRGSLQAMPVKLTPNGPGLASNASGNGGNGALGTIANGTITVG